MLYKCRNCELVKRSDGNIMLKDPRFDAIVVALGMQKRGTAGEHTDAVDDVYDISNAARLKKTEVIFRGLMYLYVMTY